MRFLGSEKCLCTRIRMIYTSFGTLFLCSRTVSRKYSIIYLSLFACLILVMISSLQHTSFIPWDKLPESNLKLYVLPENELTNIQPLLKCHHNDPYLLIVVESAVQNLVVRSIIRDTWGRTNYVYNVTVRVIFLLGLPSPQSPLAKRQQKEIELESTYYGDILQKKFIDSYDNLTLKSVSLLQWARTSCGNARYVMKADDDTIVNVPTLLKLLFAIDKVRATETLRTHTLLTLPKLKKGSILKEPFIIGILSYGAKRERHPRHKYFVPKYMYPGDEYPPYALGFGYIISNDAVKPLLDAALNTPFITMEDIFISGVCRAKAGVNLIDRNDLMESCKTRDPCEGNNPRFWTQIRVDRSELRKNWDLERQRLLSKI